MKVPKLLPWIARKAGISDQVALDLWHRAAGEAEAMTGGRHGSEFYGLAIDFLVDLAEIEGNRCIRRATTAGETPVSWLWSHQNRLSKMNLMTVHNFFRLWQLNLHGFFEPHQHAG